MVYGKQSGWLKNGYRNLHEVLAAKTKFRRATSCTPSNKDKDIALFAISDERWMPHEHRWSAPIDLRWIWAASDL